MSFLRMKIAWLILWIPCLILVDCGRERQQVIVEVNGAKLTLDELYDEVPQDYLDSVTSEQKKQFVDRWINAEILYQEALRRGLQRDPQIREKLRSAERDILISDLVQQELSRRVQVTPEEALQYYQTHQGEFTRPVDEARASQILVPTLDEANRIRKQVVDGGIFAQLAKERSTDPSASQGGDVGYFAREDVLEELARAAFSTPPGELTQPIKTDFGYHLLLVTDVKKAGTVRSFDLVKDDIVAQFSRELERQELERFLQELRDKSSIKQDIDLLDAPATASADQSPSGADEP